AQVHFERGDCDAGLEALTAPEAAAGGDEVAGLRRLLEAGRDGSRRLLRSFEHGRQVYGVCLSADGALALSGGGRVKEGHRAPAEVKLWDVATGRCLRTFEGHMGDVKVVRFSADAQLALSGSTDLTMKVWDVASGRCLRTIEAGVGEVYAACLSADGK